MTPQTELARLFPEIAKPIDWELMWPEVKFVGAIAAFCGAALLLAADVYLMIGGML